MKQKRTRWRVLLGLVAVVITVMAGIRPDRADGQQVKCQEGDEPWVVVGTTPHIIDEFGQPRVYTFRRDSWVQTSGIFRNT